MKNILRLIVLLQLCLSFDLYSSEIKLENGFVKIPLEDYKNIRSKIEVSDSLIEIQGRILELRDTTTAKKNIAAVSTLTSVNKSTPPKSDQSILGFMVAAFFAGLAALLTPCVFPIIPMTVTFFTRKSGHNRSKAIGQALLYGISIIFIYTLIGTIVAKVAGPEAANFLATHWLPNLFFFGIFILFGFSFLGMFDIVLPSSLVNKIDAESEKGGIYGIFFMAFTLVLVSFSCTGPIVGTILVESAGGQFLKPIAGMFAFSLALALPFTLFAIFPNWLSGLPKSGGWLNTVKVSLGFLELALALKFFSIADQVYHWRLLDREIYLALWIAIFSVLGIYLLGKIRLPHDDETHYISVPRAMFAVLVFSFVVYLIPGMFGAPLKALSGYLPPQATHSFDLSMGSGSQKSTNNQAGNICETPKYTELFTLPHGIQGYFDYKQALACAKQLKKPIFVDFTGHGCVSCREMESNVWSNPEVLKRLKNDFVVVALYVDDKTELPKEDWYTSNYDNKVKSTIGKQNTDLQVTKFNNNAQPYYFVLDGDGNIMTDPLAYDPDPQNFIKFLDAGLAKFKTKTL